MGRHARYSFEISDVEVPDEVIDEIQNDYVEAMIKGGDVDDDLRQHVVSHLDPEDAQHIPDMAKQAIYHEAVSDRSVLPEELLDAVQSDIYANLKEDSAVFHALLDEMAKAPSPGYEEVVRHACDTAAKSTTHFVKMIEYIREASACSAGSGVVHHATSILFNQMAIHSEEDEAARAFAEAFK